MSKFKISGTKVNTEIALIMEDMRVETDYLLGKMRLQIKKQMVKGLTERQAKEQVTKEFLAGEGPAKAWLNKQNRIIAEMQKNLIAKPSELYAEENPDMKFAWVLGSVKTSHCPDCLSLSSKEPRTIGEWRDLGFGLPREGLTACNVGCQCLLEPEKEKE